MKFTDAIRRAQATNPNYANMSTEEVADVEHAKVQSALASSMKENRNLKKKLNKAPITVEVTETGTFQSTKTLSDGKGFSGRIPRVELLHSKTLQGLSSLMRPLLAATKAITKADGIVNNNPLHVKDENGKPTKEPLLTSDNREVFNTDPLSKFKILVSILDNNKEAQDAISTISDILKTETEKLNRIHVTKNIIAAKSTDEILKDVDKQISSLNYNEPDQDEPIFE